MELKRDLFVIQKKSVFRIILGIIFLMLSLAWLVNRETNDQIIRPFDWLFLGVFVMNGVVHSIEGLGFSLARLFGKAFILIDHERIVIKTGVFAKEQNVSWQVIKSIAHKPVRCQIARNNGSSVILNLSKLDYSLIKEIKSSINNIAIGKGLEVS